MLMTIHDISDVEEQFHALDVRGQIVRGRRAVLDELIESLRTDFQAGRFQAVIIHYRIFLHHAVNAYLVRTIPDSNILAGQDTPSGSDTVKVQQALDDTLDPTPLTKELCEELSRTLHAIHPPPENSEGMAFHLMKTANIWFEAIVKEDVRLNKWWDDLHADGITSSRFAVKIKKKKRNAKP
jgi:hypothetical protein